MLHITIAHLVMTLSLRSLHHSRFQCSPDSPSLSSLPGNRISRVEKYLIFEELFPGTSSAHGDMISYQEVPRISFIPGRPVNELSGQTTLALSLLRDGGHSAVPAQALPQVARDKQGGGEGGGRGKGGVRGTLKDNRFLLFWSR